MKVDCFINLSLSFVQDELPKLESEALREGMAWFKPSTEELFIFVDNQWVPIGCSGFFKLPEKLYIKFMRSDKQLTSIKGLVWDYNEFFSDQEDSDNSSCNLFKSSYVFYKDKNFIVPTIFIPSAKKQAAEDLSTDEDFVRWF